MTIVAFVTGYLIGSIPTAVWLGGRWGVDLRDGGSGNPGAANARRLGGFRLAVLVLTVEVVKGVTAVAAGSAIGDEAGAVGAGLGAIAGNVYNVWLGFRGGKGLGISAGVLLGIWPVMLPIAALLLVLTSALTRSTGTGTLVGLGILVIGAIVWGQRGGPEAWGVVDDPRLLLLTAVGITLILVRKHWHDARHPVRSPVPR